MAPGLRRQDIWKLEQQQPWHPVTEAYARAISTMKTRASNDPTGWAYQAAVHAVAAAARGDKFRDQCQHASWFFLPWHRMYLYWFERIVRATIASDPKVGDDVKKSWALPYWDYEQNATLPPAFREPTNANAPNPLYVRERSTAINRGGSLPPQVVSAADALQKHRFAARALPGGTAGFGGPVTGWHHDPGVFGALEQTPHNDVHGLVGGPSGFMGAFDTAPLDPVFWLHHANIDRLWAVWLAQPNRSNPADASWQTSGFDFHDERGKPVHMTPAQVLDTSKDLGYTYDPAPTPPPTAAAEPTAMPPEPPPEHPPELIAASDQPLTLAGEPVTVTLDVAEPQSPQLVAMPEADRRAYLNVEGVTGERNPGIAYGLYVDLPSAAQAIPQDEHHAGNLSFFGIERVTNLDTDHGADGLRHVFNITSLVANLRAAGTWDPAKLTVTFVPLRSDPPPGDEELVPAEPVPPVTVGRVSLYVQ